ncbi:hypothetical protein NPIL_608941 [Nephila pilipes]|uniref:Uncharacterized protein n=1 Tax=Nephila pilipes TaxID=299642 RepID=A0A8X6MY43_NEPPI|nr:hypothetical protein NPIL_608941 [Nephila pilipes]
MTLLEETQDHQLIADLAIQTKNTPSTKSFRCSIDSASAPGGSQETPSSFSQVPPPPGSAPGLPLPPSIILRSRHQKWR